MSRIKVYKLDHEFHMIGEYVAVCWSLNRINKIIKDEEGNEYKGKVPIRSGDPYITFPLIRDRDGNDPYEDDHMSVSGGLANLEEAKQVAKELAWAIKYLKQQQEGS